jgi:RNA polymerase sigma factor (sigma-70 family)
MQAQGDAMHVPFHEEEGPPDFELLFAEQHLRLFRALYFVTGNRSDAAELTQDAFLKLWERWADIERIEDPTAYLFRVALNGFRMRARAARRAAGRLVPMAESFDPFDEANLREDVQQLLLRLTPRQRAALILLDMYGYGSDEAARIMRIRPSTVRNLAARGRAELRASGGPHD